MSAEISIKAISDAMNTYEQMRNNLKYLIDVCEDFHQDLENEIDGHYDILPNYIGAAENFLRSINKVKAALSLPLRNCEVGSYDEQFSRWEKHCESNGGQCFKCKFYTSCDLSAKCFAKWSQMPYEKGKTDEQ